MGSGAAGVLELALFHPVDTVAKRLMNNKSASEPLNKVIFKDASGASAFRKYASLFPGIGFAAGYKVIQRIYKFGGQPFVKDFLSSSPAISQTFRGLFGEKYAGSMMSACAGSIIGIGEVALLPLDVLKIKVQTGTTVGWDLIKSEGITGLYRGAGWTAARNAPGSFALFGGASFTKDLLGVTDHRRATFLQNFCASISGAVASIAISAPLDVVKTRIQAGRRGGDTGLQIVRDMIRKEGFSSFFKGLSPKILVVGPKLIFSFTVAQQLIPYFTKLGF
ncbi:MAG: hypothetical protein SGCHY_004952 [Lobulomycetales sp.]